MSARLDVFDVQDDVQSLDRVSEVAHGDDIDACFGNGDDRRLVNPAGSLGHRSACHELQAFANLLKIHIVEHDHFDAASKRLFNHLERFAFDLDLECMLCPAPKY